jgi:hypothetical protein
MPIQIQIPIQIPIPIPIPIPIQIQIPIPIRKQHHIGHLIQNIIKFIYFINNFIVNIVKLFKNIN